MYISADIHPAEKRRNQKTNNTVDKRARIYLIRIDCDNFNLISVLIVFVEFYTVCIRSITKIFIGFSRCHEYELRITRLEAISNPYHDRISVFFMVSNYISSLFCCCENDLSVYCVIFIYTRSIFLQEKYISCLELKMQTV